MKPIHITYLKILLFIGTILFLVIACNKDNTKGKQNSNHGLINNPPVGKAQTLSQEEDASLSITLSATDPDGDILGYKVTTPPQHGTLKGNAPQLTYVPNKDYNGKESFGFVANDGLEDSKETTVTLDISPVADLKKLTLTLEKNRANKESNISYTLTPSYDEGKIPQALKDKVNNYALTANIQDAIEDNKTQNTITVHKDGNLTLQAKVDDITSNPVAVEVYWEVNGHRLPPEPNKKLNDATLLGIDSNNNGVRDDVERWIYEKFKDDIYSQEKIAIGMQYGWAYQKIIETPTKESMKYQDDAIDCEEYWLGKKSEHLGLDKFLQWELSNKIMTDKFKSLIYNTKTRAKQYFKYNGTLSGSIFPGRVRSVKNCQVNIDVLGEK